MSDILPKGTVIRTWPESLGPILMLDGSVAVPSGSVDLDFQVARRKYSHSFVVLNSFQVFFVRYGLPSYLWRYY
jgi:hypothetical protein